MLRDHLIEEGRKGSKQDSKSICLRLWSTAISLAAGELISGRRRAAAARSPATAARARRGQGFTSAPLDRHSSRQHHQASLTRTRHLLPLVNTQAPRKHGMVQHDTPEETLLTHYQGKRKKSTRKPQGPKKVRTHHRHTRCHLSRWPLPANDS